MATVRIQLRRGTASQWDSANPTLAAGEMGVETDTRKVKIGDGVTAWTSLDYVAADSPEISEIAQDAINDALVAGTGITKSYDDNSNTITVSVDTSVIATKAELAEVAQDSINDALTAGTGITKSYDDAANTLTVSVDTGVIATQAYADQAEADAISTAAADATSKANAAQSAAEATAAADATSKANAAQSAAEATAAAALSSHESDTSDIHGIADTSILVTTTGIQTLLAKTLSSPTLTGTPVAPTAANGTDTTQIATTEFVQNAIELVVGSAPDALNTLSEIATSLNNDADLAGTLTSSISEKVSKSGDTMSGDLDMNSNKITGLPTAVLPSDATAKAYVDYLYENAAQALSTHGADTTDVHGILNTMDIVYTDDNRLVDQRTPLNNSVSTEKIVNGAVDTAKISDEAIVNAKIADGAISSSKFAAGAVNSAALANDSVITEKVVDAGITTAKIADVNVTTDKIADSAITTAKLADSNVTTAKLADVNVTTAKIADSAITTDKVADLAVTADKLADSSVTTDKVADLAVTTDKLADYGVTASKIASDSITTDKILDLNVTTEKLANGLVTESKLATDSVTSAKILDGAVTSAKIANGTIVDADINVSAEIAQSKIANLTSDLAAKALDADLDTHTGATTSVHGIADTSVLVTLSGTQTLTGKTLSAADNTITINAADIVDVTATAAELNILDGVTATAAELNILDGVTASTAELNYVDGVTSAIQTQLDSKASLAGATFTGSVEIDQNLTVDGDLTVNGTTFNASSTSIVIEDNMVQLAHQNAANTVDLGLVVAYNDGSAKHAGIVRDVSDAKWKLFKGVATEPSTTVAFGEGSLDDLAVASFEATSATIGDVSNTELQYLNGVTSAIQTQIDAKAPIASPTFTGTVTVAASGIAYTDGTQTKEGVPSRTPISQKASNYTLGSLTDRDTLLECTASSGTTTITVPTDATLDLPIGTSIDVFRFGAGEVSITTDSGATLVCTPSGGTNTAKLRAQYSTATLFKRAANSWIVFGDLKA